MALIVETGNGVSGANSYVDLAYARAYAAQQGLDLPVVDADAEVLLHQGMAAIESFGGKFQGFKADADQATQFPRSQVYLDGFKLSNDVIPETLKVAQVRAAIFVGEGIDFFATVDGQLIIEETVGPITTKYGDEYFATIDGQPIYKTIISFLEPLLVKDSGYRLTSRHGF